jgi:hypothetical protein
MVASPPPPVPPRPSSTLVSLPLLTKSQTPPTPPPKPLLPIAVATPISSSGAPSIPPKPPSPTLPLTSAPQGGPTPSSSSSITASIRKTFSNMVAKIGRSSANASANAATPTPSTRPTSVSVTTPPNKNNIPTNGASTPSSFATANNNNNINNNDMAVPVGQQRWANGRDCRFFSGGTGHCQHGDRCNFRHIVTQPFVSSVPSLPPLLSPPGVNTAGMRPVSHSVSSDSVGSEGSSALPYQCEVCDRRFTSGKQLSQHEDGKSHRHRVAVRALFVRFKQVCVFISLSIHLRHLPIHC